MDDNAVCVGKTAISLHEQRKPNVLVLKLLLGGNAAGGLGNLNPSPCELDIMWIYTQHLLPEEFENKGRVEFFCCQNQIQCLFPVQ